MRRIITRIRNNAYKVVTYFKVSICSVSALLHRQKEIWGELKKVQIKESVNELKYLSQIPSSFAGDYNGTLCCYVKCIIHLSKEYETIRCS